MSKLTKGEAARSELSPIFYIPYYSSIFRIYIYIYITYKNLIQLNFLTKKEEALIDTQPASGAPSLPSPNTIISSSKQFRPTTAISTLATAAKKPDYDRDITKDLFNNLERTTLLAGRRDTVNASVSSVDNATVTEASYTGNVKIHEVNKNGYYVRLLNLSNTVDENLSNYTIQQVVSTMPVAVFRIPANTKLAPGHTMTVWSRTDDVEQQPPHTFIWYEQEKWGTGPECTTILAKPNGQVKEIKKIFFLLRL